MLWGGTAIFEYFVSLAVSTAFPVWGHLVQPGLLTPFREQTLPAEVYILKKALSHLFWF